MHESIKLGTQVCNTGFASSSEVTRNQSGRSIDQGRMLWFVMVAEKYRYISFAISLLTFLLNIAIAFGEDFCFLFF